MITMRPKDRVFTIAMLVDKYELEHAVGIAADEIYNKMGHDLIRSMMREMAVVTDKGYAKEYRVNVVMMSLSEYEEALSHAYLCGQHRGACS